MKGNKLIYSVLILVYVLIQPDHILCQYAIQNSFFGNGGTLITDSTDFTIGGNIGQQLIGKTVDDNYVIQFGFWYQSSYFITSIDKSYLANMPGTFVLYQNYPNPFNPLTTIKFTIPQTDLVKMQIFNTLGQIVSNLVQDELRVGSHEVEFNASNLPSGIYLYRLQAGDYVDTKKMLLIK